MIQMSFHLTCAKQFDDDKVMPCLHFPTPHTKLCIVNPHFHTQACTWSSEKLKVILSMKNLWRFSNDLHTLNI